MLEQKFIIMKKNEYQKHSLKLARFYIKIISRIVVSAAGMFMVFEVPEHKFLLLILASLAVMLYSDEWYEKIKLAVPSKVDVKLEQRIPKYIRSIGVTCLVMSHVAWTIRSVIHFSG